MDHLTRVLIETLKDTGVSVRHELTPEARVSYLFVPDPVSNPPPARQRHLVNEFTSKAQGWHAVG